MTDHDHNTVVVDKGGSGMGAILGVVVILILAAAVWYFALGPGRATNDGGGGGTNNTPTQPAVTQAPAGS